MADLVGDFLAGRLRINADRRWSAVNRHAWAKCEASGAVCDCRTVGATACTRWQDAVWAEDRP